MRKRMCKRIEKQCVVPGIYLTNTNPTLGIKNYILSVWLRVCTGETMQLHVKSIQIKQHLTSKQKHCEYKSKYATTLSIHTLQPTGPGPQSKCLHCPCHPSNLTKT